MRIYCGPAAIMALTGEPVERVHEVIREHRLQGGGGHRKGTGRIAWMLASEVSHALDVLEAPNVMTRVYGISIAKYLREYAQGRRLVVLYARHFIAVSDGLWTDSLSQRDGRGWRPYAEVAKPRAQVHSVIRLT